MARKGSGYRGEAGEDSPEIWTKEARRIEQITRIEDQINDYKEQGRWDLVLNKCEDYLRFQIEAIEEKDPATKKKVYGIDTTTYTTMMEEIQTLLDSWEEMNSGRRKGDPSARLNASEDRRELIRSIKKLIDQLYHNNVVFKLTYREPSNPEDAWMD